MAAGQLVRLSVGGIEFLTTRATLQNLPHSLLAEVTSGNLDPEPPPCDLDLSSHDDTVETISFDLSTTENIQNNEFNNNNKSVLEKRWTIHTQPSSSGQQEVVEEAVSSRSSNSRSSSRRKSLRPDTPLCCLPPGRPQDRASFIHIIDREDRLVKGFSNRPDSKTHNNGDNETQHPTPTLNNTNNGTHSNTNNAAHKITSIHNATNSNCHAGAHSSNVNRPSSSPRPNLDSAHSVIEAPPTQQLFFDRNPVLMPYILDVYRIGQLHLPCNVCSLAVREELRFWKIPEDLISECCWKNFHQGLKGLNVVNEIDASLSDPYDDPLNRDSLSTAGKVWLTMERPGYNMAATVWMYIYYTMLVGSLVCFSLTTLKEMQELQPEYESALQHLWDSVFTHGNHTLHPANLFTMYEAVLSLRVLDHVFRAFFTIEFIVRLFCCPSKLSFIRNGHNILDLFIILTWWCSWLLNYILTHFPDDYNLGTSYILMILSCFLVVRVLRTMHLAKHMAELKVMYLSTKASLKELFLLVVLIASAVLLFGTLVFLAETLSDIDTTEVTFDSLLLAMWWAVITMTTVGYGDVSPKTPAGYVVGTVTAMCGLLLVALPIAIIASNFSCYYDNLSSRNQMLRRRDYVQKTKGCSEAQPSSQEDFSSNVPRTSRSRSRVDLSYHQQLHHARLKRLNENASSSSSEVSGASSETIQSNDFRYDRPTETTDHRHKRPPDTKDHNQRPAEANDHNTRPPETKDNNHGKISKTRKDSDGRPPDSHIQEQVDLEQEFQMFKDSRDSSRNSKNKIHPERNIRI